MATGQTWLAGRTPRVIRQPVPGRALQQVFMKGLRLPRRVVLPAIQAAKIASNPAQYRLRRRLAEEVAADLDPAGAIDPLGGYRFFDPDALPGVGAAVERCAEIVRRHREQEADVRQLNPNKSFLLSVIAGPDFLEHPDLLRFMVSRPLLDPVTAYLGSVPILAGANLLLSPPNESERSSQLWHIDDEERSQVKVFINLTETGEDQGPFTFLPADVSERVGRSLGYDGGRLPDDRTEAAGGAGHALRLLGPPGRGVFVDTSRCLHFGSRANRRERLVLLVQFWRFHAPSESKARLQVPPRLGDIASDRIQALALGLE